MKLNILACAGALGSAATLIYCGSRIIGYDLVPGEHAPMFAQAFFSAAIISSLFTFGGLLLASATNEWLVAYLVPLAGSVMVVYSKMGHVYLVHQPYALIWTFLFFGMPIGNLVQICRYSFTGWPQTSSR